MRHSTSPNWKLERLGMFLAMLRVLASGCAMNEQARSDWQWQQMNPNYKPPVPPDGRPQWEFGFHPDF
jgi:hypothetical protein